MRLIRRNKQPLYYALYKGKTPVYQTDLNGNIIYDEIDGEQVPRKTGVERNSYSKPVKIYGHLAFNNENSFGNSESDLKYFGVSREDYDSVLIMLRGEIPANETSLFWVSKEPTYLDAEKTEVDPESAEYTCSKVSPSMNFEKFMLKYIVRTTA